ncbi:type I toxin-antitoxin system Ibs family toxin [Escherichia coli]|nr:type I toxin-antitoxin system Ibs family toxin [Escherichia coli]QCH65265.1 type I toxin-antitoxin system Ibs family toxin [Escherichia coli O103:H2]
MMKFVIILVVLLLLSFPTSQRHACRF